MATLESMQRMTVTTQWLAAALRDVDLVAEQYPDGDPATLAQAARDALDALVVAIMAFESSECATLVADAQVQASPPVLSPPVLAQP